MTRTVWPRASAAARNRAVECRLGLRDRMASFTVAPLTAWSSEQTNALGDGVRRGGDCSAPTGERLLGIDDEPTTKRTPAQQHAESHRVAPGKRELDAHPAPGDHDRRADHRSPLDTAVARPHFPPLHELGRGDDREREVVLAGAHHEPHERTART